jgi:PAS domain S-box-containing protein
MLSSDLLFQQEQLNRLFPFYLLFDASGNILSCGKSLQKICPGINGSLIKDVLRVRRPQMPDLASIDWKSLQHQLVILDLIQPGIAFRGQLEPVNDTHQWLFLGSPWFESMEQVTHLNLSIHDFALHDPMIDLLHVLKTKEITTNETKQVLEIVKKQKDDLKKANTLQEELLQFSYINPHPKFQLNAAGIISLSNSAASNLQHFSYQHLQGDARSFWRSMVQEQIITKNNFTLELISDQRVYEFAGFWQEQGLCWNVYGHDITQNKANEAELRRLSMIASDNENGILYTNADGRIFWANQGFCQMTGFTPEDIMGRTPLELCQGPESDESLVAHMLESFSRGASFQIETAHYRKDGTWFWGRTKGQAIRNETDDTWQYFAMIEDISDKIAQDRQLKILSQIAEDNINAVVIADAHGRITWVNKSFTRMTGFLLEECIGQTPGYLLQGPDTNPQTVAYLRNQIWKGESFDAEILNYHKNKKPYWVRVQGQPIRDAQNRVTGFFALEEDITRERRVQEEMQESTNRFKMALEKIGDNVWEHDFRTGITLFTKSDHEFMGIQSADASENTQRWWSAVHPDDRFKLEKSDADYRSGIADSHNLEYRLNLPDGSFRWVLDRGVVMEKNNDGIPVRIIGTHTDITHIKQTEEELASRVKQLQLLSDNVPGVIYEYVFRVDGSEGFRYLSPAMERIFGIPAESFFDHDAYIHPDDKERIAAKNIHSRDTLEPYSDESRLVVPGRGVIWRSVSSSFSYRTSRGDLVFTGFMLDITERKNAEEALRTNEEKYRSIIANMKLGLLEVDLNEIITYANQSFCDMSGYTLSELTGKKASALFVRGESAEQIEQKNELRKNGISDAYEIVLKDRNGNQKWWLISGAPRYNDSSELVGSIGIHLDITEQKNLEHELIHAREQAEALAKTKESFLANMSHEIRTPMNAILGMSNQLAKTNLNDQQKFFLNTIHAAADNLLVIINDILDLSKIQAGKLNLEKIGFASRQVVADAMQVLLHRAEEKGIRLTNAHFDPAIHPILLGDPYRLNQILLNIISNAIKFTDKGYVDFSCLLLHQQHKKQTIEFRITDTGIGMDEAFVEKLFDSFSQEYQSISRRYGGTGLGMSICKQLVDMMGGSIRVNSKKGTGTTVSIVLDFDMGKETDLPRTEEPSWRAGDQPLQGKHILLTDDNEMNRLVASTILQQYGAIIQCAENGGQAIDAIQQQAFDLVLMDIQMPVKNGYEATEIIRKELKLTIPIIALTANAIKGEQEKCLAVGMNDYVSKPFREEDLVAILLKWMPAKPDNPAPDEPAEALYNLTTLQSISRGNEAFVQKMIALFCRQMPDMLDEMNAAAANQQWEEVSKLAHKMKPSIDNLQILSLHDTIRNIEKLGKEKNGHPMLNHWLQQTNQVIGNVITALKATFHLYD